MNWFSAGQAIGVLSALGTLAFLAVLVLSPPYAPVSSFGVLVLVPTGVLAVGVVAASLAGSPGILLIAFVVSFLPLGLNFLLSPGIFKWVGVMELGYLLSAALLFYGEKARRRRTTRCNGHQPPADTARL